MKGQPISGRRETDRAFIVRVRPDRYGSGYRASVQDMGVSGHVPAYANASTELAAVIGALIQAKLGPPLDIPAAAFDALERSEGRQRSA